VSERNLILAWAEQGLVRDVSAALRTAGVLPSAGDWRAFLDRLLLWSGAVALAAAVVFFIAHNWNDLGRFAKFALVQVLLVAAVIGYWKLGAERATGKASLMAAAILLGALLALFGQTYQTGADTWELFATWAALMAPWVIVGRFAALWMLWLAIANLAIVLYYAVFARFFGFLFAGEEVFWVLFAFDTLALLAWELAARRIAWLDERWAPRLLAIAGGAAITWLAVHAVFEWRRDSGAVVLAYPVWLGCLYYAYRVRRRDLLILAGACLSVIVVVTAAFARVLLEGSNTAGSFLFVALVVIGMAAAAGWWLKQLARETPG